MGEEAHSPLEGGRLQDPQACLAPGPKGGPYSRAAQVTSQPPTMSASEEWHSADSHYDSIIL